MQDGQEGHWACGDQVADVQVEDVQERLLPAPYDCQVDENREKVGFGSAVLGSEALGSEALGLVGLDLAELGSAAFSARWIQYANRRSRTPELWWPCSFARAGEAPRLCLQRC